MSDNDDATRATQIILGGTDYSGTPSRELHDLVKLHLALARAAKDKGQEE